MTETTGMLIVGAWLLGMVSSSLLLFLANRQGAIEARRVTDLLARQEERQRCLLWLRQMAWTPMPVEVRAHYFAVVDGVQTGILPPVAA